MFKNCLPLCVFKGAVYQIDLTTVVAIFSGSSSKKSAKKVIFKAFVSGEDFIPWWNEHGSKVHIGIGCDYCGVSAFT